MSASSWSGLILASSTFARCGKPLAGSRSTLQHYHSSCSESLCRKGKPRAPYGSTPLFTTKRDRKPPDTISGRNHATLSGNHDLETARGDTAMGCMKLDAGQPEGGDISLYPIVAVTAWARCEERTGFAGNSVGCILVVEQGRGFKPADGRWARVVCRNEGPHRRQVATAGFAHEYLLRPVGAQPNVIRYRPVRLRKCRTVRDG